MKKILVVDDESDVVAYLTTFFQDQGYSTVSAPDGEAALAVLERERPDLVILDLIMPETSGFNVAYQLKQIPATRSIPIIILTSMEIDEEMQEQLGGYVSGLRAKSAFSQRSMT